MEPKFNQYMLMIEQNNKILGKIWSAVDLRQYGFTSCFTEHLDLLTSMCSKWYVEERIPMRIYQLEFNGLSVQGKVVWEWRVF